MSEINKNEEFGRGTPSFIERLPRGVVQIASAILTNGYLKGFVTGRIFQGNLKHVCIPTLNCYSCPGALFACPIGAAQVIIASGAGLEFTGGQPIAEVIRNVLSCTPVFIIGFLSIVGALVGRATCGWACPFGWFQELVYKIPIPKFKAPKFLRWCKYIVLVVMVVLLPLFWVDKFGSSGPYFCKLICPAGTLEGGIPLPLLNPDLRDQLKTLFRFKLTVLGLFIVLMAFFRRPFCSWACPLGAFLAPMNRASFMRLTMNRRECVNCGACNRACPADLDVVKELDGAECIRCFECSKVCPKQLIRSSFG